MRIARNDPCATYAQVILDGVNLKTCVAADSVQGWADVLVEDGKTYVRAVGDGNVKAEDGGFQVERRYGVVVIAISTDYPGVIGSATPLPLANEMDASEG